MTINRGLWVPINTGNVGTTDLEGRLADGALFESNNGVDARSGILHAQSSTLVTGTATMSYNLGPCNPVINRAANEGTYRFTATGTTAVATTAAPAANSRIDVIWVKQNDQNKGDANNLAVAGVTQGVVAASPVAPSIPAGALEIARATVGPNITATTAASITQTFRHTALKGAPIPVRNTTERAEITAPRPGQLVRFLDIPAGRAYLEVYDGAAWTGTKAYAEFSNSAIVNAPVAINGQLGPFWQAFPTGRFSVAPNVMLGQGNTRLAPEASGITTEGFNLYVRNDSDLATVAGASIMFYARQATPTSAAG